GWDVLFSSHGAAAAAVSLPSQVFTWLALVFGVGFSMLALMTRRWALAWVALAGAALGSAAGVLCLWLRPTRAARPPLPRAGAAGHPGAGVGLFVAWITVMVLTFHWARVVWARTVVQLAAEEERRRIAAQQQSMTLLDSVDNAPDTPDSEMPPEREA